MGVTNVTNTGRTAESLSHGDPGAPSTVRWVAVLPQGENQVFDDQTGRDRVSTRPRTRSLIDPQMLGAEEE
jgi:hypothetical protein